MIEISNVSVNGITRAVYSARNAMNSWDKSDSDLNKDILGTNDLALATRLAKAGTDHRKFMRMIVVYADVTAPLYWWKEYDTYKVGAVANSCSTMHKIHEKEFVLDDFSYNKLFYANLLSKEEWIDGDFDYSSISILKTVIEHLNKCRNQYNIAEEKLKRKDLTDAERKHIASRKKFYWWQIIQLLPSSYNQKRTVMLNYEVLHNMYHSRKNHKLDEWHTFCDFIETLPYVKELIINE